LGAGGKIFETVDKWQFLGEPRQGWVLTDELEKVTSGLQGVGEGVQSGSVNQGRPDKQGGSGYQGPQP
jgi:hypothetical protein